MTYLVVVLVIIFLVAEEEGLKALSGGCLFVIILGAISLAVIGWAFSISPILGFISIVVVVGIWRSME